MPTGKFVDFYLPFMQDDGSKVSATTQAQEILNKAQELINKGAPAIGIIYSANYGQTLDIEKTYKAGGWDTRISGANQARVMTAMETLMGTTYASLQGKMYIAPITTMNAFTSPWNDTIHMNIVINDLARMESCLQDGWYILGWQNEGTINNPAHPYAVGGGIATGLPAAISAKIQQTLIGFTKKYT